MESFFKNLGQNIIANLVWTLLAIGVPIFWGIISNITTDSFEILQPYRVWIVLSGVILVWALLLYLFKKYNRFKPRIAQLDPDFETLLNELTLIYSRSNNIIYKKRKVLKALRGSLNSYQDRFGWTGDKDYEIINNIPGQEYQLLNKTNLYQYYNVIFEHNLEKGEEIEIDMEWKLSNSDGNMSPFHGSTINEPTKQLNLALELPRSTQNQQVFCELCSHLGAKGVIKTERKELDRNGKVRWEVSNPKLLHHYHIRWVS